MSDQSNGAGQGFLDFLSNDAVGTALGAYGSLSGNYIVSTIQGNAPSFTAGNPSTITNVNFLKSAGAYMQANAKNLMIGKTLPYAGPALGAISTINAAYNNGTWDGNWTGEAAKQGASLAAGAVAGMLVAGTLGGGSDTRCCRRFSWICG